MGLPGFGADLDQKGAVQRARSEGLTQACRVVDMGGHAAEAARQGQEVRRQDIHPDPFDAVGIHIAPDLLVAGVVPQQDHHRQAFLHRGGQLGDGEHDAAVADQRHHRQVGPRQLGTECRRQAVAEGAVAGRGVEVAARSRLRDQMITGIDRCGGVADQNRLRQMLGQGGVEGHEIGKGRIVGQVERGQGGCRACRTVARCCHRKVLE